jgi:S1-C subfamily serine protease
MTLELDPDASLIARPRAPVAVVLAMLVVALAGCGGSHKSAPPKATRTVVAEAPAAGQPAASIPELVRRVSPSVVAIAVKTAQGAGEGSGVVWDRQGHIVTNNHVVEGASSVQVETAAGQSLPARVVATDPLTDLAVLKLGRGSVPPVGFAQGLPQVGELALAMGSPLGLENTVTAGIVSGLDRSLPAGGREPSLVGLLQTDAAISPGNSGGALVGADGRVIGINVAYLPPQQTGAVSIGFAIPAPTVRDVVGQLIAHGRVAHPYLGVQLTPAATEAQQPVVIVAAVEPGGPAERAGIAPRDILTRVGSRDVTTIEDVYDALRGRRPGQRITVKVRRGDQERTVDVTLGRLPEPATGG